MQNTWRVMGMWDDGRQFLLVMGSSQKDCEKRIWDALEEYSLSDLEAMDSMWHEEWKRLPWEEEPRWEPTELISLRRYKLRKIRQKPVAASKQTGPASAPVSLGFRLPPQRPAVRPVPVSPPHSTKPMSAAPVM